MTAAAVAFSMSELWPQTAPLRTLEDLIEEHAEELAAKGGDLEAIPAIAALLAFDESDFKRQLERLALKSLTLRADAEAAKIERVRIELREKRWEKARVSLNGYILRQMQGRDVKKFKTVSCSVTVANNGQCSVRAKDDATLETLYASGSTLVKENITYTIDHEAAVRLWKEDEDQLRLALQRILDEGGEARVRADVHAEHGDVVAEFGATQMPEEAFEEEIQKRLIAEARATFTARLPEGIIVTRGQHVRIS